MERGLGVFVDLIMGKEKHLDDLEKKHPDLANRFRTLRGQLAIPADLWNSSSTSLIPHEIWVRYRQMAYDDLIDLIVKIRSETEFDDFLFVQLGKEVMGFGKYGPFVLNNISRYRCDAFLIQKDRIHDQQLTDLTLEDLQKQAKYLDLRADDGMKFLLNWVWDTIKGPCLHALGSENSPEAGSLPHVEWVFRACRKFERTTAFDIVVYTF
ncbi:uncharacterized protein BKA55DRAFT_692956 [Fusarium redolens]|uniref:Uncharacterized protein n=1 Tax=Fusarium redolens TaxID=48865 RepID=A0A9P9GL87_FUSRE|nr:uncharacterized protein BKA55DRAFT_692956 [Fusarium redolens]KAH7240713.1 hypothetical protein BKA55DRAFT_692956 [Fusarium redolens]